MRLRPVLPVLLIALISTALIGCSRKAERLVGADRLIRGPGGLGTTVRLSRIPDRDTFVENGTAVFDSMLIVGTSGAFDARSFLFAAAVTLPDTTLPGFTPFNISLEFHRNLTLGFATTNVSVFSTTVWDTTSVSWPGPPAGTLLGSASDDRILTSFSLVLGSATFPQAVQWAQGSLVNPPRFLVQATGQPLAAYQAGTVKLRIRYNHTVGTQTVLDSIDSPVTQDFYLHSPLSPAPSGSDSSLVWGGLFQSELAMHFLVDSIPTGVSVDEATLVLHFLAPSATPDTADVTARVEIRGAHSAWSEGVTERSGIPAVDSTAVTSGNLILLYSPTESRIAIRLPGSLMRAWAAMPSTNGGVVVTLVNKSNLTKQFLVGSRESSLPPELHVSYTSLPPGRL